MQLQGPAAPGLVAGRLATDPVVRLELDWAAARWLLAPAEVACPTNRAYEAACSGAWDELGVRTGVAVDPVAWTAWLAAWAPCLSEVPTMSCDKLFSRQRGC